MSKKLRLIEARKLMLDQDYKVGEAAFQVGYVSLSQFNCDYKKLFSHSPKEDIRKMKELIHESKNL